MKILHLTIKKKWFDLIASGKKVVEYRKDKAHWRSRLRGIALGPSRFMEYEYIKFDEIHFRNGYKPHDPFMRTGHIGTTNCHSDTICPRNGEELDGVYFLILLGEILEVRR